MSICRCHHEEGDGTKQGQNPQNGQCSYFEFGHHKNPFVLNPLLYPETLLALPAGAVRTTVACHLLDAEIVARKSASSACPEMLLLMLYLRNLEEHVARHKE